MGGEGRGIEPTVRVLVFVRSFLLDVLLATRHHAMVSFWFFWLE